MGRRGGFNGVKYGPNVMRIRAISRVNVPKWPDVPPYYRDVTELKDEKCEKRVKRRLMGEG